MMRYWSTRRCYWHLLLALLHVILVFQVVTAEPCTTTLQRADGNHDWILDATEFVAFVNAEARKTTPQGRELPVFTSATIPASVTRIYETLQTAELGGIFIQGADGKWPTTDKEVPLPQRARLELVCQRTRAAILALMQRDEPAGGTMTSQGPFVGEWLPTDGLATAKTLQAQEEETDGKVLEDTEETPEGDNSTTPSPSEEGGGGRPDQQNGGGRPDSDQQQQQQQGDNNNNNNNDSSGGGLTIETGFIISNTQGYTATDIQTDYADDLSTALTSALLDPGFAALLLETISEELDIGGIIGGGLLGDDEQDDEPEEEDDEEEDNDEEGEDGQPGNSMIPVTAPTLPPYPASQDGITTLAPTALVLPQEFGDVFTAAPTIAPGAALSRVAIPAPTPVSLVEGDEATLVLPEESGGIPDGGTRHFLVRRLIVTNETEQGGGNQTQQLLQELPFNADDFSIASAEIYQVEDTACPESTMSDSAATCHVVYARYTIPLGRGQGERLYVAFAEATQEWIDGGALQKSLPETAPFKVEKALDADELEGFPDIESGGSDGGARFSEIMHVNASFQVTFTNSSIDDDFAMSNRTKREAERAIQQFLSVVLSTIADEIKDDEGSDAGTTTNNNDNRPSQGGSGIPPGRRLQRSGYHHSSRRHLIIRLEPFKTRILAVEDCEGNVLSGPLGRPQGGGRQEGGAQGQDEGRPGSGGETTPGGGTGPNQGQDPGTRRRLVLELCRTVRFKVELLLSEDEDPDALYAEIVDLAQDGASLQEAFQLMGTNVTYTVDSLSVDGFSLEEYDGRPEDGPRANQKPLLVNSSFLISSPDGQTAQELKANLNSTALRALKKAYRRFVRGVVESLDAEGIEGEAGSNSGDTGGPPSSENGVEPPPEDNSGSPPPSPPTEEAKVNGGSGRQRHLRQMVASSRVLVGDSSMEMTPHRQLATELVSAFISRRRLKPQYDGESADIYDLVDSACTAGGDAGAVAGEELPAAVSKQATTDSPNDENCITVFGKYRVYVEEEDDVEQVYQSFVQETQQAIATGALEESLQQVAMEGNETVSFSIEGVSPVVDNSFDAFVEIEDDSTANSTESPASIATDTGTETTVEPVPTNSTTAAPTATSGSSTNSSTQAPDNSGAPSYSSVATNMVVSLLVGVVSVLNFW